MRILSPRAQAAAAADAAAREEEVCLRESERESARLDVLPRNDPHSFSQDEDLRWVEENIPTTITTVDTAFPNLPMDSDEVGWFAMFDRGEDRRLKPHSPPLVLPRVFDRS